jgi:hypothetical protein
MQDGGKILLQLLAAAALQQFLLLLLLLLLLLKMTMCRRGAVEAPIITKVRTEKE